MLPYPQVILTLVHTHQFMPSLSVETRSILRAHGLHPKKALGQNFLIDREALQSVVRAAEVRSGDVVLEIGPGVGTLTTELADQGAEIVAVELDERLAAQPGDMSLLGVMAQFYARVEFVRVVPASSFLPAPQVDSAIVRLRRHKMPPVTVDNVERFFKVVKAGFGEKRKQLHNALVRGLAHIPAPQIDAALEQAGIDRTRRAETLSLEEWGRLYHAIGAQTAAQRKQPSPSRTQRAPLPDGGRGEAVGAP